jgi:hypothetical protein
VTNANDLANKAYVDAQVAAGLPTLGTAGTYTKVTTDAQGRVISGTTLAASDIPNFDASKITTGNLVTPGIVSGSELRATNLKIYNGANYLQFSAPAFSGNVNCIVPNADGGAGHVLKTDGAGNLSWVAPSAGALSGLTSGYLPKATSSNTIGNSVLFESGGSVGIGTITPAAKLDVIAGTVTSNSPILRGTQTWNSSGTTFSAATINVTDTASAATSKLLDLQVGGLSKFSVDKTGKVTGDGSGLTNIAGALSGLTSGYLTKSTSSNTIGNSALFESGGNLGIGTATPASKFQVQGSSAGGNSDYSIATFENGSSQGLSFGYDATNDWSTVFSRQVGSSPKSIAFFTSNLSANNPAMIIKYDGFGIGNVGIGTTTPGSKLQVASTNTATSGQTYGMQITPTYNQSSSSANNTDLLINRTETAVGSGTQRLIEAQVGGVTRFSVDSYGQTISESSYNLTNGGSFSAQFASDGSVAALSALGTRDMIFRTTDSYTERMRITTSGKVGIGVTTPTSLLTLKGAGSGAQGIETYGLVNHMYNSTTSVPLSIYAADVLDVASTTGSTNRIFRWGPQYINSGSVSGVLGYDGGSSTVHIGSENADLTFSANGWASEHMRISSSGNIGVGTGAPRGKLDVTGAILGAASTSNTTTTVNFSAGNIQHTNSDCQAFALNNLKDGASYMFIVKGTSVATCSFTAFSDAGLTALTVHLPPGHTATTAGKHTLYNMAVSGGDVYFSWVPGY